MKTKPFLLFITFIALCLESCNTYSTFYKPNDTIYNKTPHKTNRLNVEDAKLDLVLNNIEKYHNIRVLNLSSKTNTEVDTILQSISQPLKIKVLILNNCNLKQLPESIIRFKNLSQLSLNNNPKLNLTDAFNKLEKIHLQFINLQNNNITALPKNITKMQWLVDFNLSGNTVNTNQSFNYLKQLPRLKSLWLTNNKLNHLPEALFNLTSLKCLYIEHNNIYNIPEAMQTMKKLWIIHAGHNKFKTLPKAFAKMPALLLLHINNCEIDSIPSCYSSKTCKIAGIILDHNKLSKKKKNYWKKEFHNFFLLSM